MDRRELWIGNEKRFGIFQRLGLALLVLSLALIVLAFNIRTSAPLIYFIFVTAHAILYTGFTFAAAADWVAGRRFSVGRLFFTAASGFLYLESCPVVMSAAIAARQ